MQSIMRREARRTATHGSQTAKRRTASESDSEIEGLRSRRGIEFHDTVRPGAGHHRQTRVELYRQHALAGLFAVTGNFLHARTRAKDVPEADGAVVATGDERETRRVERDRSDCVQVREDRVCALP